MRPPSNRTVRTQRLEVVDYRPSLPLRVLIRFYRSIARVTTRERAVEHELVRCARLRSGEHALDVGCGSGTLSIALAMAYPGAAVTGLDANVEALVLAHKNARARGALINLEHGLAQHLPYEAASFELVVSRLYLHHGGGAAKNRALAEALRVTKPGGRILIADWGQPKGICARLPLLPVQVLDGCATMRDSVIGHVPRLIRESGFDDARWVRTIVTPRGIIGIFAARRRELTPAERACVGYADL